MSALNSTRQFQPRLPDFVIFSGDSASHGVSPESFLPTMRAVSKALQKMFPSDSVPVIPVLGNHDVNPDNFMNVPRSPTSLHDVWCNQLATDPSLWKQWLQPWNASSNISYSNSSNFSNGCFYSKLVKIETRKGNPTTKSLRIVALNGLIWYRWNRGAKESIPDPFGQFAWLTSILNYARANGESVLLIMHFPVGATENSPERFQHLYEKYNEKLVKLVSTFSDVLIAGLFAHQHTDSFRVLKSDSDPILSLFLVPSISPMRLLGLGYFNPRIRLFKFLRSNLKIVNYHQYFLNLSDPSLVWRMEYSAIDEYNLPDLSPASLSSLLESFLVKDSNWRKYWSHQLGGPAHESGSCPRIGSSRRCTHLCAMKHLSIPSLRQCLTSCEENTSLIAAQAAGDSWSTLPIVIIVILAFVLILIGIVFCVNRELCRKRFSTLPNPEVIDCNQKLSATSNAYAHFLGSANPRATSLYSRNSSLDGMIDLNATGDERSLIAPLRNLSSTSGLGRLSGFVKFSRCNNNRDSTSTNDVFPHTYSTHKIQASYKYPSYGGLPSPLSSKARVGSNEEISSSIQLNSNGHRTVNTDSFLADDRTTIDFESEERAYDAEVEDDDDEDSIPLPTLRKSVPFKNFMNGLPSTLGGRCLLNAPRYRRSDIQLDASDNEYYSIHSSLQCLHPVVTKDSSHSPECLVPKTAFSGFTHNTGEILNGAQHSTSTHPKCSSESETIPSANASSDFSSHTSMSTPINTNFKNGPPVINKSISSSLSVPHSGFLESKVLGI